jgi:hypothetical protein
LGFVRPLPWSLVLKRLLCLGTKHPFAGTQSCDESKSPRPVRLRGLPTRTKKSTSSKGPYEFPCVSLTVVGTPGFGGSGIVAAYKSDSPSSSQNVSESPTAFLLSVLICAN